MQPHREIDMLIRFPRIQRSVMWEDGDYSAAGARLDFEVKRQ
jgi:hypothetical protein